MADQSIAENTPDSNHPVNPTNTENTKPKRKRDLVQPNLGKYWVIIALITYLAGMASGYMIWNQNTGSESMGQAEMSAMAEQINPTDGYKLPVSYGDFGPKLLAAGVIDYEQFVKLYQDIGAPLDKLQTAILKTGSNEPIVIDKDNKQFLLNLFWALGLANQNKILTEGPIMKEGKDGVVNFASTGGWTLGAKPVSELFASQQIFTLTDEQQANLDDVSQAVYRPCCNNPTHFPDCNHGMAMLGLLELMASQGASKDAMFEAAKYVNAYWFPQQTLEISAVLKTVKNVEFADADARAVVSQNFSSGSGYQAVHQYLVQNGSLQQGSQSGGSCGVK